MRWALCFAGLALTLSACNSERSRASLPPECRPRPDEPPPPPASDDDVTLPDGDDPEAELDPFWFLRVPLLSNPACEGERETPTIETVRWTNDAGVQRTVVEGRIVTSYSATEGRCRIHVRAELSAALPPGRAEVQLFCAALVDSFDWATLDELDIQLAGFGMTTRGKASYFPVQRPLNVRQSTSELECDEAALSVSVEDPWPHFQVNIDIPLEDWLRLQSVQLPRFYAGLTIDMR